MEVVVEEALAEGTVAEMEGRAVEVMAEEVAVKAAVTRVVMQVA